LQPNYLQEGFSPREILIRAYRDWWLLLSFMLLGALVGWIIFTVRTPVYQAEGEISIGIDFTHTGTLSDVEEDQLIGIVGDVISSPLVLQSVVEKAGGEGINVNLDTFKTNSFSDRRQYKWVMGVRDQDPQVARRLATLWTQTAYNVLIDAHFHSIQASSLQRYLDSLESCLQRAASTVPFYGRCSRSNLENILEELGSVGAIVVKEIRDSHGILSPTTISLASLPKTPTTPIYNARGGLILSGALTGFILGVVVISSGWSSRVRSNTNHD
jgi:hypothetical protein